MERIGKSTTLPLKTPVTVKKQRSLSHLLKNKSMKLLPLKSTPPSLLLSDGGKHTIKQLPGKRHH